MSKKNKSTIQNDKNIKLLLLTLSSITLISIVGFIYYFQSYNNVNEELSLIKTGYTTKLWQPAEKVETPDFTLTVNSAGIDTEGIPQYLPLPDGMEFITIDLNITNKTEKDLLFLPINSTYLKDQDGNKYGLTTTANVRQEIAGNVAAGDTNTGQVGFMIPQDTEALRFYFEPYGEAGGETIVVDLNSLL